MSDERQDVIVLSASDISTTADISSSVPPSSCSTSNTSGVLTKLIAGSNTTGSNASNTFILYIPAFRKIEPKPGVELKSTSEEDEKELVGDKDTKSSVGRFLAINATKRGVKKCPVCQNKIGYRAKQCKHCSPSKIRNPRKTRLPHLKPSIAIKPVERKTVELLARHVACSSSETSQGESSTTPQEAQEEISEDLMSEAVTNEQLVDDELPTMVPLEHDNNRDFEGSLIEPQGDHQVLDVQKVQDDHQLIKSPPQEAQQQLGDPVGNILNQTNKIVLEESEVVGNVTEVATSGECVEKQATSSVDNQGVINTVFISSKIPENIDNQSIGASSSRYSLQDLICGLLAQNSGANVSQTETKEAVDNTAVGALDSNMDEPSGETTESRPAKEKSTENAYDANSVALFLGEMAQRNNGKKRKIAPSKSIDGEAKVMAIIPETNQKCFLLTESEHKSAKFRKIQPKDIGIVQEDLATPCDEDKETPKETNNEIKGESQIRLMNGNATRRGVMLCPKCNKMIGCRSKICKHCKHKITADDSARQTSNNKLVKQAVKLCLPQNLGVQIFSVRKCKTGPELRCFVQFDHKSSSETSPSSKINKYSCDYPLCITAKELGDKVSSYMCEHAKVCCTSASILKAKIPKLDPQKLMSMEFCPDIKKSVQKLYDQCQSKDVPLVQYVSCRTLAVVEQINTDSNDPLGTDIVSFAHVRFENVKGQGCFQRQVFCSGRSCMAWNFLSSDSNAAAIKPCSCVHYAASLWAIASDVSLQKDLKEYLDAFVTQVRKGTS